MSLESALKAINILKPGQHFTYRDLAKRHCCCRTTLSRNHKGKNAPHAIKAKAQLLVNERDEIEVVQYIKRLTERHVMPTRQMIVNFITPLVAWEPSYRWVSRFLHRNQRDLLTAWATPLEALRHKADSIDNYRDHFTLLHATIDKHQIDAENTYNMDEKGFMIGVIGRSVIIFDKQLYGLKQYKQSSHVGNRKWVTVLAAIRGDGSTEAVQQDVSHKLLALQEQRHELDRREQQLRASAAKQFVRISKEADRFLMGCVDNLLDANKLENESGKDIQRGSSEICADENDIESDEDQLQADLK